jgi:hypothetical protein
MDLIADSWIMDLAERSEEHHQLAGVLLKVQLDTFRKTGHLLDYSQEYVHRRFQTNPYVLQLRNVYVRCLRCGCVQRLVYWIEAVGFNQEARDTRIQSADPGKGNTVVYLEQCMGNEWVGTSAALLGVEIEGVE